MRGTEPCSSYAAQVRRLAMYSKKAKRDKNGKILHQVTTLADYIRAVRAA